MTDSRKKTHWDFAKFDSMETAVLESFLRADVESNDSAELDIEVIRYISGILAERQNAAPAKIAEDVAAAKVEFYESYYPAAEAEEILYDFAEDEPQNAQTERPWLKSWRRLASAAAVLLFLVFGGTFTAYALGYDPLAVVAGLSNGANWPDRPPITLALINALENYSEVDLVPKWLPDGYNMGEIVENDWGHHLFISASASRRASTIYLIYDNWHNAQTVYRTMIEPIEMIQDKDFVKIAEYKLQDVTYYILGTDERRTIVWQNGDFGGSIAGQFSLDEALKIINSIPAVEE